MIALAPADVAARLQCSEDYASDVAEVAARVESEDRSVPHVLFVGDVMRLASVPQRDAEAFLREHTGGPAIARAHWDAIWHHKETDSRALVYFLQGPEDSSLIKIGCTTTLEQRLGQIQRHSPVKLRVVATMLGHHYPTEQRLHDRFAHLREHGEWFRPESDLLEFIRGLK